MSIKKLPEIRIDLCKAESWARSAGLFLNDVPDSEDLENAKTAAQQAKKLLDEAIVDLDGLLLDTKRSE